MEDSLTPQQLSRSSNTFFITGRQRGNSISDDYSNYQLNEKKFSINHSY